MTPDSVRPVITMHPGKIPDRAPDSTLTIQGISFPVWDVSRPEQLNYFALTQPVDVRGQALLVDASVAAGRANAFGTKPDIYSLYVPVMDDFEGGHYSARKVCAGFVRYCA